MFFNSNTQNWVVGNSLGMLSIVEIGTDEVDVAAEFEVDLKVVVVVAVLVEVAVVVDMVEVTGNMVLDVDVLEREVLAREVLVGR